MKRTFFLIILATSCFLFARATDYYVDATAGSNTTGDGTSGNPWQTITYALSQITGTGHTLNVAAGTYDPTLGETFPILIKNGVSLVGAGIDVSIIDANSTNTVIQCISILDTSTRVEGFTITGGGNVTNGAGLSISAGSAVTITGNRIANNSANVAGGGLHVVSSSATITNNTISGNSASSNYGGGIYLSGSSATITNNIISGNFADNSGGGIYLSSSSATITDNTISGNTGDYKGGGLFISGGSAVITDNIISGNKTTLVYRDGGGLYISDSSPLIMGNTITGNVGALNCIYITGSTSAPRIVNNVIAGNSGVGIDCLWSSAPDIINNTIAENSSDGISIYSASPDSILNNILFMNSGYGIRESDATSDPWKVWYNLFYANTSGLYNDEGTTDYYTANSLNTGIAECDNNIEGDPMFVDRLNSDYRLSLGSPAIDAGDPDPQFNDPDGSRNDIGALALDTPPAVPQNLSATAGAEKITLRWNPNTEPDMDIYNIYRDLLSPAITFIDSVISTSPSDTFYVDTGLIVGQDYYYRIKAKDIAGKESDFSVEVMGTPITGLQQDSLALVALYDSTDEANWTNNANWLTGPVSTWVGVTVSGDRVTQIDLNSNNLVGTIPPEIGNITNLTNLDLYENQLSGAIPNEIGNLTLLTQLHLSSNQLSGSIPAEIGKLIKLRSLDLFDNQLQGQIPSELASLTQLEWFHLDWNSQLTPGPIPSWVFNLTKLTGLHIAGTNRTGTIPTDIANLTFLNGLNLSDNQLTGSIPNVLGNLTGLTVVWLGGNQLSDSIPSSISNLTNLEGLYVDNNNLSGAVPNSFINLIELEKLHLFNNKLDGLPNLSSLDSLDELKIENNQFTFEDIEPNMNVASTTFTYSPQDSVGEIIDTTVYVGTSYTMSVSTGGASSQYQWKKDGTNFGSISSDSTYTFYPVAFSDSGAYTCEITNTAATDLTLYSRPVNVFVNYSPLQKDSLALVALYNSTDGANWTDKSNWLTGNVSTWFGITVSGERVTQIELQDNNLNGIIPPEIGNLTNLKWLGLVDNQLTGSIPMELTNLINLEYLHLSINQLTGTITSEIGNMINLRDFEVGSNSFTGSIPTTIGNLTDLVKLSVDYNQLTGIIPSEIGNLTNLENLGLSANQLTGIIPTEIGNLTNLTQLNIFTNQLTGSIPAEIGNLTNLQNLNFEDNQLSGSIPSEITNLTQLSNLYLHHNQFTDLPDLSILTSLEDLQIQNNKFTFKDIEPNIGITGFVYSPQDSVGEIIDTTVYVGTSYTMSVSTGGASSLYQWKKGGTNFGSISSDSTYTFNPVAFSDSGTYTCEITNTVATDLTLYSRPVHVSVPSALSSENDILTYSFSEQTGIPTIDNVNHTVDIEVTYGTDVTGLVATFTISALANITVSTTSQVSGITSNDFTSPVTYTVTAEDGTAQDWVVTVTLATSLSSENDILTYSFAEQTGPATIDDVNHTVDIEVVYGTNLANLVATFSISSQASVAINSIDQISGVTANNFTNPVTYTVTAEDGSTQDWIITVSEAGILVISDFPYFEDFESGNGGWRTGGANSSWEHGIPSAGQTINSAASGTNAWVTSLTGDYNPDEISYVTSPRFDLSGINYPKIEFSIWWYAEGFYDGANLQYKEGTGEWKTLGADEGDDSWYNSSYLYSIEKGFGFDIDHSAGWSGDDEWGYGSDGWVTVDHALTSIDYQSAYISFRIGFASNSGYENDGIAIDDINIYDDPTGINETNVLLSDIQIYPNPNEGKFRLVYNGERDVDLILQLINIQGQVVLTEQIETGYRYSKEFELDYLPAGLYYFRLKHKEGVVVKKMVIRL